MTRQTQACCQLGHPFKKRHFSDPKVRRMESGALQVYGGSLDCNACHREINASQDFFFTCEEMCDYDLCFECFTCPNEKQLYKAFKPYEAPEATCLRCNESKPMETLLQCVCASEDHFVCAQCLRV